MTRAGSNPIVLGGFLTFLCDFEFSSFGAVSSLLLLIIFADKEFQNFILLMLFAHNFLIAGKYARKTAQMFFAQRLHT
jgi:hypothetical protein